MAGGRNPCLGTGNPAGQKPLEDRCGQSAGRMVKRTSTGAVKTAIGASMGDSICFLEKSRCGQSAGKTVKSAVMGAVKTAIGAGMGDSI